MATSPPTIIIDGGSVGIEFDPTILSAVADHAPDRRRHSCMSHTIDSVEIIDKNNGSVQKLHVPANGKCTVKITLKR